MTEAEYFALRSGPACGLCEKSSARCAKRGEDARVSSTRDDGMTAPGLVIERHGACTGDVPMRLAGLR